MTYRTKNLAFVFAFAAIMVASPMMASQQIDADSGTSSMNLECGVTTPGTIAFGAFSLDTPPAQFTDANMEKLGAEIGTFEVVATDWVGVAQRASVAITVLNPAVGNEITINGIDIGVSGTTDSGDLFQLGADNAATAVKLATAINANTDTGTVTSSDIFATAVGNTVIVRAVTAEAAMNAATISQTSGTGTLVASNTVFSNSEDAGVKHMEAENTKYKVTVDGSSSSDAAYAAKTALDVDGIKKTLAAQTQATTNLQMSLEIAPLTANMIALPYNGALTQTLTFTSVCNQS